MSYKMNRVFVYGTLKTGQIRESMWPHTPKEILPMKTRGWLYDLGAYPAMTPGDDWVLGELWRFDLEQMPKTLEALDAIEGYHDTPSDLYRRVVVHCVAADTAKTRGTEPPEIIDAYTYHFVQPLAASDRMMSADGLCCWPE